MNEIENNLVLGFIILLLIINTTIAFSGNGNGSTMVAGTPGAVSPAAPADLPQVIAPDPVNPTSVPEPVVTVLPDPGNPASADPPAAVLPVDPSANAINATVPITGSDPDAAIPASAPAVLPEGVMASQYVTVGLPEQFEIETHEQIQPALARRSDDHYVTLYSLNCQPLTQTMSHVYFNLANPPLVINYDVTPNTVTITKRIELHNKTYDNPETREVLVTLTRPYELTWAEVIVRNKDTGQIVYTDGFGRTYSFESPRQILVLKPGNYDFEFNGDFGLINLTMKAVREGNIQ
jgi:hypothetical protein